MSVYMSRSARLVFGPAIALSLGLMGCDRGERSESLAGALTGQNVLLITLDTTRADRLGCYGFTGPTTPTLDALAARAGPFLKTPSPRFP